jgi:hypothetical protein
MKFDKFFFNILFGIAIPLLCFILSWWTAFVFTSDLKIIKISALSGLAAGIIISLFYKIIYKPDIYRLSVPVLILVYLFYNAVLFSMFMGVPFFHLFLGMAAGFYWSKYIRYHKEITDYKAEIRRISLFTSVTTGVVSLFSASIALLNKSTTSDLESMFRLPFKISQSMLVIFLITGGFLLVVIQYLLVRVVMKKTISFNKL